MSTTAVGRCFLEADNLEELKSALQKATGYPKLQRLGQYIMGKAKTVEVCANQGFALILQSAWLPRFVLPWVLSCEFPQLWLNSVKRLPLAYLLRIPSSLS